MYSRHLLSHTQPNKKNNNLAPPSPLRFNRANKIKILETSLIIANQIKILVRKNLINLRFNSFKIDGKLTRKMFNMIMKAQ